KKKKKKITYHNGRSAQSRLHIKALAILAGGCIEAQEQQQQQQRNSGTGPEPLGTGSDGRSEKYMTFWTDCGGFNNIRMVFEYMVMVARLTNRVLVTPPEEGWYLIDWGGMSRMKTNDHSGRSEYSNFFDFDDLNLEVKTITAFEFAQQYGRQVGMPESWTQDSNNGLREHAKEYKRWCNRYADEHATNMPWGPLGNVLFWPSISAVEQAKRLPTDRFMAGRKRVQYSKEQQDMTWVHFPIVFFFKKKKGWKLQLLKFGFFFFFLKKKKKGNYRYLGQVSTFVWFSQRKDDLALRRVLRDHVHLRKEVFEYASYAIEFLGLFQYAAVHIRRNELQYRESFLEASISLQHIRPLIKKTEAIYISTDETNPHFFAAFEKEFKIWKYQDLFGEGKPLAHVQVPRRLEGVVEMVICAAGRIFFGTDTSTFTSYITRLRGYVNAPDKHTYHHNEQWTGNLLEDIKRYADLGGDRYMDEFPEMWEDIYGT
ncbi:hypothetical protein RFI_24758, partial [Reticulomyxa filosa]